MNIIYLETKDEVLWVQLNGIDYGTQYEFENDVFGITPDYDILDCGGCH